MFSMAAFKMPPNTGTPQRYSPMSTMWIRGTPNPEPLPRLPHLRVAPSPKEQSRFLPTITSPSSRPRFCILILWNLNLAMNLCAFCPVVQINVTTSTGVDYIFPSSFSMWVYPNVQIREPLFRTSNRVEAEMGAHGAKQCND